MKDLIHELRSKNIHSRVFSGYFKLIHNIWNRDMLQICNNVIQSLYRDKINENEMLQKIDVYSLGMQIPFVFIQEGLLHYLQTSTMVFDFFGK